jgi:epoxyqueuosine reductase QueG
MSIDDHPTVKRIRDKGGLSSDRARKEKLDSEWIKGLLTEAGAADAGLVEIDRPDLTGQREDILTLFPHTKTLVSFVCPVNRENIRSVSRSVSDLEYLQTFETVDAVSRNVVATLERSGIPALYAPSGFPMDTALWPGKMWPVSHKPIAAAAGLGHMGHHRMVIHPEFGNFIVLGTLLLGREVTAHDRPLDFNPCIECKLCVSVCPVGAISPDGHFNFVTCMAHNYRDRLGGFSDWVEKLITSTSVKAYRKKVGDTETVSIWQSLYCGICNKCSYCMAVCPAGAGVIEPYLDDRKGFLEQIVKPLQQKEEAVYTVPGSDGEPNTTRRFPHKTIKRVGTGLRATSVRGFLASLPIIFQPDQSEGLTATYHFTFTGGENCKGTVAIRDKSIEVKEGHVGTMDLHLIADSRAWVDFLAKEKNLIWALVTRKIRIKGPPRLLKAFARCFPA